MKDDLAKLDEDICQKVNTLNKDYLNGIRYVLFKIVNILKELDERTRNG